MWAFMSCPACRLPEDRAELEASALPSGEDLYTCPCGVQYSSQLGWAVDHPDRTNAKWRRAAQKAIARGAGNRELSQR